MCAPGGKRAGRYAGFCTTEVVTAIYLGAASPQPSSGPPDTETSSLIGVCLTLLRARFTQRARSLGPLVVSYTTVSPLPPACAGGGLLSVALSRGLLRVGVTHRPALRSPDVPRRSRSPSRGRVSDATVWPTHLPCQASALSARRMLGRPWRRWRTCRRASSAVAAPTRSARGFR